MYVLLTFIPFYSHADLVEDPEDSYTGEDQRQARHQLSAAIADNNIVLAKKLVEADHALFDLEDSLASGTTRPIEEAVEGLSFENFVEFVKISPSRLLHPYFARFNNGDMEAVSQKWGDARAEELLHSLFANAGGSHDNTLSGIIHARLLRLDSTRAEVFSAGINALLNFDRIPDLVAKLNRASLDKKILSTLWQIAQEKPGLLAHEARRIGTESYRPDPGLALAYFPVPKREGGAPTTHYGAITVLEKYRYAISHLAGFNAEDNARTVTQLKDFMRILDRHGSRAEVLEDPGWNPMELSLLLENYLYCLNAFANIKNPMVFMSAPIDFNTLIKIELEHYRKFLAKLICALAKKQKNQMTFTVDEASILDAISFNILNASSFKKEELTKLMNDLKSDPIFANYQMPSEELAQEKMLKYLRQALSHESINPNQQRRNLPQRE